MAFQLTNRTASKTVQTNSDESEFSGIWLNIGMEIETKDAEGNPSTKFVRIPRGVAVADLVPHKIYASTNPDWAAEAGLINQVIEALQEQGVTLEEGEAKTVNLSVQLYRRQETMDAAPAPKADKAKLVASLFS